MTASPVVMHRTGSVRKGSIVLILGLLAVFAGTSWLVGGLRAPPTVVLMIVPLMGFFLLDRQVGWMLTGLVTGIITVFLVLELSGIRPDVVDGPDWLMPTLLAIGFASTMVVNLVLVLQYDSARDGAFRELTESHARLESMIDQLDATSSLLSRSAAQFLGSAPKMVKRGGQATRVVPINQTAREIGLTQQMLDTASDSRAMIESVGESIRGMIAQYVQISTLISELSDVSDAINEMVDALNKISSRLEFMALNTALEAARAGEAGKGFLVLAHDMRRLAERVLQETGHVKESVLHVQTRTHEAIEASTVGHALTEEGISKLEIMSMAFGEMHALIERIAQASRQMTENTIEQLGAIHDLVDASLKQRRHREASSSK